MHLLRMVRHAVIVLLLFGWSLACVDSWGQPQRSQKDTVIFLEASTLEGSLRTVNTKIRAYDFSSAIRSLEDALAMDGESTMHARLEKLLEEALCAERFQQSCEVPVVVARRRFSASDYYLYYPLPDLSWRPLVSVADSATAGVSSPLVFFPLDEEVVYFSSLDDEGAANIYTTSVIDTLRGARTSNDVGVRRYRSALPWEAPKLLSEGVTSVSNDIHPMLSPDRKTLFFSSDRVGGMGGYDLYRSDWDETQGLWGEPVNMGFPYSTPSNDYLFMTTSDGSYNIFASDRGSPRDSIDVYVLQADSPRVTLALEDPSALKALCKLDPPEGSSHIDNSSTFVERSDDWYLVEAFTSAYNRKYGRDTTGDTFVGSSSLRKIEDEFLRGATRMSKSDIDDEADRRIVTDVSGYTFSKKRPGRVLSIRFLRGQMDSLRVFTYDPSRSATVTPSEFPHDSELRYTIALQPRHASLPPSVFATLSPCYYVSKDGRTSYYAGLFGSYQSALSALNTVRRAGFPSARIAAVRGGVETSIEYAIGISGQ